MQANRNVLPKVWKGLKFARQPPLLATPFGEHASHDREREEQPAVDAASLLQGDKWWNAADLLQGRGSELKNASAYQLFWNRDFGKQQRRSLLSGDNICATYEESSSRNRLDVFPLWIDIFDKTVDYSLLGKPSQRKTCKPATTESSVQTEPVEEKNSPTDDVYAMINKLRGDVENQLGVELAEDEMGPEAIREWRSAAERGSVEAIYNLALCYSMGDYVAKDINKAMDLWKKAALQGHALSMYQLAVCYIRGLGSCADKKLGNELMEKSADKCCAQAQFFMASKLLREGEMVRSKDYLRGALRRSSIRREVSSWLQMDSLPQDVRDVVEHSLHSSLDH